MPNRDINVLVVDDEASTSAALKTLLVGEGFRVRVANDGQTALALVAESAPDLIVTDFSMPAMTGLELLTELRCRGVEAPVILATANDDVASALAAIRAGAVDYLAKPIEAEVLVFAIERALRTQDLAREAGELRLRNDALAAEAERNLRAREELLAIVAHDLRGPLTTMMLAADLCAPNDEPAVVKTLAMVERAAKRMSKLIEELLDVARIEAGGLLLQLDATRASLLLDEALSMVEPIAASVGIAVELAIVEDFPVHCAAARVVQVLVNLASNAINVSGRGTVVKLAAERRGDRACFAVIDEGPGIAPENLTRVFEHGWRSNGGRRQGAGLGLTIAKGIVEAHAGTLTVESTVGVGTTFRVEIPVSGPASTIWRITPA
ncbi:MAG: response regulator [Polyangiales bacterium]